MRFLKGLLLLVAGLLLVIVVVGLFLPTEFKVTRSIDIKAPPAKVHSHVNDLERWPAWQPWIDADPSIVVTRGATTKGVGASQSWTSKEGPGELTVVESDPSKGIAYSMLFDGQWKSRGELQYQATADGTRVTWQMTGGEDAMPVIGGYFALSMDGMVGPMFDNGLAKLKAVAEK